ncbi:manganese efflux pump [Actinotalea ferrariae]|uniref:manganese efflux pump MntP n=1 Tax=Actinotalea ferrariae TaxID=1386098 RepID=UPI001C8C0B55|nr:manganese efflux pump MntP family protein [Actinotalea ferrariae]MBX9244653.1 manganese efflux pump [Actinotalea ferrariae]
MPAWTLLLIALGVSADAFAVALGKGLHIRRLSARDAGAIAVAFGLFQALMPVLGWLLGSGLRDYITEVDHWVAFALLTLIGAKMLHEALSSQEDREVDEDHIGLRELLVLSVATSIDALAVGISFAFLEVNIAAAALMIGFVTALVSLAGVLIGHRAGTRFRGPAEIAGGLILIAIGVRILLEHLGVW